MLVGTHRAGFGGAKPGVITAGLQLWLDAGDAACYPGSGQNVLDLTASDNDFYLGATSGASGDDPTFNGAAGGKSSSEYLSFDGGDTLVLQAAHSGEFLRNIGKRSQDFSLEAWVWRGAGDVDEILFSNTDDDALGHNGLTWFLNNQSASRNMRVIYSPAIRTMSSTAEVPTGQWCHVGVTGELFGSVSSIFWLSGSQDSFTLGSQNTWTAGDSSAVPCLSGRSSGSGAKLQSGSRIAIFRAYNFRMVASQFRQNWFAEKSRFGF